eukprot:gene4299-7655_t
METQTETITPSNEKIETTEELNETTDNNEPQQEENGFDIVAQTLTGSKIQLSVSRQDSNIEIKQSLIESAECCYITNFDLTIDGMILEEYKDLSLYPEVKPKSIINMKFLPYDDKTARLHYYRFREILESTIDDLYLSNGNITELATKPENGYPSFGQALRIDPYPELNAALDCDYTEDSKHKIDSRIEFHADNFSLTALEKLSNSPKLPMCLKRIGFSGWNPAPNNRKLFGDLFYLVIETLENKTFHITATPNGFFVNGSTDSIFDPNPVKKGHQSQTLAGLLFKISKQFQTVFPSLLKTRIQKHPYEVTSIPFKPNKWTEPIHYHTFNQSRSEDSYFKMLGVDPKSQLREWNEEYQGCKELPSTTSEEKTMRDRSLFKIHCDFVEAATQGAKNVVDNCINPINPNEPFAAQVFLQNNIFYSFAVDSKTVAWTQEAHRNASHDLKGVIAFNEADVKGINTVATAVVDYRGYRVICQSVIPGILTGDQASKQVYGAIGNELEIEEEKTFSINEKYHELIKQVAEKIHLKEHTVVDEQEREFKIFGPSELKGVQGSDDRFYVLDLARTTPRDPEYKEDNTAVFRKELIRSLIKRQYTMDFFGAVKEEQEKAAKKQIEEEKQETKQEGEEKQELKEGEEKQETKIEEPKIEIKEETKSVEEEKIESEEERIKKEVRKFSYNVDSFTKTKLGKDKETIEKDENEILELSEHLTKVVIPGLVEEFKNLESIPLDGFSLTENLHERGINMRYLGKIATLCNNIPHIHMLCEQEMFVRSLKQDFRSTLRKTNQIDLMNVIVKYLNSIFGTKSENQKKKLSLMIKLVKEKYSYNLEKSFNFIKLSTLRNFCIKVGLKIQSKDYNFESKTPFAPENILSLEACVKHSTPKSLDAAGFLELGKQQMLMGQLEASFEFLTQSMIMFQQIQGPMNKEVATCFSHLGNILLNSNDIISAILHQHKSLIICRRIFGNDSALQSNLYQLLGLLCHTFNQPEFALKHFLRAKYINDLINGSDHPDTAIILANIASMYQELNDIQKALVYMEKAISMNERVLGFDHIQTASNYHSMALLYSMVNPKIALEYEKKNFKILSSKLDQQHVRVLESSQWLQVFTQKAVKIQKDIKKESLAAKLKKQNIKFPK